VGLTEDAGVGLVGVDTAPFVYFVEDHPRFADIVAPLFDQAASAHVTLVTAALTLMEVLVVPYRAGDQPVAERYEALLTRGRGIELVDLSRDLLREAARLRGAVRIKTPDAIQLAAALRAGCKTFVTNDRRLPPIPGLRIIELSSYAA